MKVKLYTTNLDTKIHHIFSVHCSLSSKKYCIRQLNEVRDDLRYYNEFKTIGRNSYAIDNKAQYSDATDADATLALVCMCLYESKQAQN